MVGVGTQRVGLAMGGQGLVGKEWAGSSPMAGNEWAGCVWQWAQQWSGWQ